MALLLDRGGLRIALGDDQAPEFRPILAGNILPGRLALVPTEIDVAFVIDRGEEDAPSVVGHADVVEMRPPFGIDADRGAQIDFQFVAFDRA